MKVTYVLDASAVLAYLQAERGWERVEEVIDSATISSVNLAEVLQKVEARGSDCKLVYRKLTGLNLQVSDFGEDDALSGAKIWRKVKSRGLSLADRACLGLAQRLDVPALTSDRTWLKIRTGARVELIR